MAKKVVKKVKIQAPGGAATPAPPLGPTLGQTGINIGEFVKRFNDATKEMKGQIIPAEMILKAIGKDKGSGTPNTAKIGKITKAQIKEIAETKMADLNAKDLEGAMRIIEGTARSMGVDVV